MGMILTRRYNVDRFGYLIPHRYGNLPMLGAVATFRPGEGRFGRGAVAVEEGTTNHIPSSRLKFEGWIAYQGAKVTVTQGYSIPGVTEGGATRIQTSGGDYILKYLYSTISGDAGNSAAYSVWVYNIGQKTVNVWGNTISVAVNVAPGEVKWCTGAVRSLVPGQRQIQFRALDASDSLDFIAFQPQIETKPFPTSFVAGTRAAGRLVYPTSVFNPAQGTISMWVRKHQLIDYNARVFWSETGSYRFGIYDRPNGSLAWTYVIVGDQTIGGFLTPGTWHHLVMTWHRDEGWMRGYLDGEPVASRTFDPGTDPGFVYSNTWGLGATVGGSLAFNGLFDDLLILPYAASGEEIRAWYEADSPLPPHPDATLQWDWREVRPAQMVTL